MSKSRGRADASRNTTQRSGCSVQGPFGTAWQSGRGENAQADGWYLKSRHLLAGKGLKRESILGGVSGDGIGRDLQE